LPPNNLTQWDAFYSVITHFTSLFFHTVTFSVRWEWVAKATTRPLYPRERPGTYCNV
jgi:hypothetical protein